MVHDSGINPNCLGSMTFNNLGFNSRWVTKSSAIFDSVDVKDTGLKSLLKSSIFWALGSGNMSAIFHTSETLH